MKYCEIFKAGTYPQGTFTKEDIELLAKNYDPKFCEAPITLDHEQSGPAYGWIKELKAENGVLKAVFRDVSGELKELVLTGKYKKVSVEIYKDLEGRGPYLKAVTFLGAGIPQVKGMEPVEFKEGESKTYIFEVENAEISEKELITKLMEEEGKLIQEFINLENEIEEFKGKARSLIEQPDNSNKLIAYIQEMDRYQKRLVNIENRIDELYSRPDYLAMQEKIEDLYKKIEKFTESEKAMRDTEHELSKLKSKIKKNEFEQFLNENLTLGILSPAQKDLILNQFNELDSVKQFGETDYIEIFEKFIKTLPKQIEFNEIATKKKQNTAEEEFIRFENADEDSLAIYSEVKQLAEKENIPFKDALLRLYE